MIENNRLSVVTVVRNSLPLLKETIESINSQTCSDYEYILVDGNSTDGTRDYVLSLPLPVTNAVSEDDAGIYDAMNKSIKLCTGEYIQFLNAGDRYLSNDSIQQILPFLNGDADIVLFGFSIDGIIYFPDVSMKNLIGGMVCHQAIFYKRSVLLKHSFDISLRYCADYKHLLSSLFRDKIYIATPVIVEYDMTGISSSPDVRRAIRVERARAALTSNIPFYWKLPIAAYNILRGIF